MDYSKRPGKNIEVVGKLKNKANPTISIVTPFYNGGATLVETAYSVFNQTYPFFEWIIVDDGSKDEASLKKLDEVSKIDPRIKVFHKENEGPSVARDFGISKCNSDTKYVFFLDCDDIIDKTMLECLYWTLETHPDASFAYTSMINFGDREFLWEQYLTVEREKRENIICISSMVKKFDLLEVGCFGIKEKAMYEDWNLWLKLLEKGKKPIRVSSNLFWYRTSNTGELSRAKKNNENAMKYVNESASKIKNDVSIIQFPRSSSNDVVFNKCNDMVLPMYESEKKKNILFLFPWMVIGGADIFNLEMIKRLGKDKYSSYVLTTLPSQNGLRQDFEQCSTAVYDMAGFLEVSDYLNFIDYIVESRNIDVIFVSNSKHGYSVIPFIKAKYPNILVVDYVHSIDFKDKRFGFGSCTYEFDSFIDKTLTCNNFTNNQLKDIFKKSNAETLYIGTDIDRFDPAKFSRDDLLCKYGVPNNKKIITFLARLSEEKRPNLFVKIASRLLKERDDLFFLIVGDGGLYNSVSKEIKRCGISSSVKMLGPTNIPEEIYAISDLTVNCSRLEGLALTSFESLAMGVPVVSTDVGGQTELIDDKVGYVVHYGLSNELDEYVKGCCYVLDNLEKLSSASRKRVKEKFTYDSMINNIKKVFDSKPDSNFSLSEDFCGGMYLTYSSLYSKEFNWIVDQYNNDKFGVSISQNSENESSKKSKIKNKFKFIASRYNCVKEMKCILNTYRFFSGVIINFKNFIFCLIKFVVNIFISFAYSFVILFKFIKKRIGG